jgi:hypothetical protein
MHSYEQFLLKILQLTPDANRFAVVLQSYIAEMGPVSEETGAKIRELLKQRQGHNGIIQNI